MTDLPAAPPSENHRQLTSLPQQTSIPTRLSEAQERLRPATSVGGTAELMACLTLVAPSGMSAEDRDAWVQVARATLSGMPGDLLATGCMIARRRCKFVSELVPTILEAVESQWNLRRKELDNARWGYSQRQLPPPEPTPEYITAQKVRKLIRSLGSDA
jgi:hypothetical protein